MKIAWLYHDFMDLYGDKGNIMVLQKRCEDRGIPCQVDKIGIGDETDLCDYDLIFLGGGADKEQLQLIPDLMARRENIRKAMDEGTFALLICGGYQLFGEYYIAADGTKIDGLGFHSYYTDTGKAGARCIGNIVIEAQLDGRTTEIMGFENHGGQTCHVTHPLGKVIKGCGNSFDAGFEGYLDDHMLGTYIHGPLLPKNPDVADFVIVKAMQKRNPSFRLEELKPLDDSVAQLAREQVRRKLGLTE